VTTAAHAEVRRVTAEAAREAMSLSMSFAEGLFSKRSNVDAPVGAPACAPLSFTEGPLQCAETEAPAPVKSALPDEARPIKLPDEARPTESVLPDEARITDGGGCIQRLIA